MIDCIEGRCSTRRFHPAVEFRSPKEFEEELLSCCEIAASAQRTRSWSSWDSRTLPKKALGT